MGRVTRANRIAGAPPMGATMTIQQQQMQQQTGNYDARLGVLENDVAGIKSGISLIMQKLDGQGKVPWGALISALLGAVGLIVTIVGSIGALAFSPLSSGIADLKAAVVKMEGRTERYVPREDLDTRFATITQRRDDLQRLTDARVERAERDLESLQKQVVPRGEHAEVWAGQRGKDENIQRQIDGLRKELSDLNTPRDTIQAMQRRIDELERMRRPPGG